MSDDLVRRLACPYPKDEDVEEVTLPVWVILLTTEAADRIEELEGQLQSVLDRETSILRYYDAKLDAADAKLAKALEEMMKVDEYLTRLQTPNTEPLNSVNSCPTKKGRGQYTAMVRNEAREYWASLGNAIAELKGEQP